VFKTVVHFTNSLQNINNNIFAQSVLERLIDPPLYSLLQRNLPAKIVPQGSVQGPPLFILYTTLLRSLISDSSVKHHLDADDTQLFISFSARDFSQNISHLETTYVDVS